MSETKCTHCGKRAVKKYRPFCSKRCADLDLGQWLNGSYHIQTDEEPEWEDLIELQGKGEEF